MRRKMSEDLIERPLESIIVGKTRLILLHEMDARHGKPEVRAEDLLCWVLSFLQVHGLGFPAAPRLHGI